jgi:hypothetical protein
VVTTVVKTIGTGGDYATIQAWIDAAPFGNLVSADKVWQGQLLAEVFDTGASQAMICPEITMDATRYAELTCAPGAFPDSMRYRTDTGKAAIQSSAPASATLQFTGANRLYFRLTGIQVKNTVGAAVAGVARHVFSRCIFEGGSGAAVVSLGQFSTSNNCLFIGRTSGSTQGVVTAPSNATVLNNCTLIALGVQTPAVAQSLGTVTMENCAAFNVNNAVFGGATLTATTCLTDLGSPPTGFTTTAFSTSSGAMFQNVTDGTHSFEFRNGSSLQDAGTTDTTNAATDIFGTARPTGSAYDVGAWERTTPVGRFGDFDPGLRVDGWW